MKQISTLQKQIKEFNKVVNTSQTSINHIIVFTAICEDQPTTSSRRRSSYRTQHDARRQTPQRNQANAKRQRSHAENVWR